MDDRMKEKKRSPIGLIITSAVLLLVSAGLMIYVMAFAPENNEVQEQAPAPAAEIKAEEEPVEAEPATVTIRSFGGELQWFDGSKWVGIDSVKAIKASDPVLAALSARDVDDDGTEEEKEIDRLLSAKSGRVAEPKAASSGSSDKKTDTPAPAAPAAGGGGGGGGGGAPAPPAPPAGPTSGDGQNTDAGGL